MDWIQCPYYYTVHRLPDPISVNSGTEDLYSMSFESSCIWKKKKIILSYRHGARVFQYRIHYFPSTLLLLHYVQYFHIASYYTTVLYTSKRLFPIFFLSYFFFLSCLACIPIYSLYEAFYVRVYFSRILYIFISIFFSQYFANFSFVNTEFWLNNNFKSEFIWAWNSLAPCRKVE